MLKKLSQLLLKSMTWNIVNSCVIAREKVLIASIAKLPHSLWLEAEIEIKFTCVNTLAVLIIIHSAITKFNLKYIFSPVVCWNLFSMGKLNMLWRELCAALRRSWGLNLPADFNVWTPRSFELHVTRLVGWNNCPVFFFFRSDMDGWKASRFYQNEARKAEERHLWILSIFEAPPKRTRL